MGKFAPPAPAADADAAAGSSSELPPPDLGELPVVYLRGVALHAINERQTIRIILNELAAGHGGTVVTPNLDHLRRCVRDLHFRAMLGEADLVVADGMPLIWASRLQGTPLPGRVAGSDLISSLSAEAARAGRSLFLLGGAPGTAEGAAGVLRARHPGVKIAGTYCPPLGFEDDDAEMGKLVEAIRTAAPDIIFVALGSPKQERLIDRIRDTLPSAWWLGVGVSFSFLTGHVQRAPGWLQKVGLEWTHRLVQEPRRLFKRYVIDGIPFAVALLARSVGKRLTNSLGAQRSDPTPARYPSRRRRSREFDPAETAAEATTPAQAELQASNEASQQPESSAVRSSPERITESPTGRRGEGLWQLRAVVLLGGSVRTNPLGTTLGRSVLDLPVRQGESALTCWLSDVRQLASFALLERLPVRLVINEQAQMPASVSREAWPELVIEQDRSEFRGTGGVLRDMAADFDDDDLLLVGNAAQVLLDPLTVIATVLEHKRADVALVSHADGTPSGMMLLRVKTLRDLPPNGYVDMKEQGLPKIAQRHEVRVVQCRRPTGLPLRSLHEYVRALRLVHQPLIGRRADVDPLAEDFDRTFWIVEENAQVSPDAYLHDSVVLSGGKVEAGASVVRSVIGPGGVVAANARVLEALVARQS